MVRSLWFRTIMGAFFLAMLYLGPVGQHALIAWLDRKGIAGATWLYVTPWEILLGTLVVLAVWGICCFARFSPYWEMCLLNITVWYALGLLGSELGVLFVTGIGILSRWSYGIGFWPSGAALRIVEVLLANLVIWELLVWAYGMARSVFIQDAERRVTFLISRAAMYPEWVAHLTRWWLIIFTTVLIVRWFWTIHWVAAVVGAIPALFLIKLVYGVLTLPLYMLTTQSVHKWASMRVEKAALLSQDSEVPSDLRNP